MPGDHIYDLTRPKGERQFKLVRAHQFLRKSAKRVGVELRIGGREIDKIICMGESRVDFSSLRVIEKSEDLFTEQRPGEPLHVVLHENLHCRAVD